MRPCLGNVSSPHTYEALPPTTTGTPGKMVYRHTSPLLDGRPGSYSGPGDTSESDLPPPLALLFTTGGIRGPAGAPNVTPPVPCDTPTKTSDAFPRGATASICTHHRNEAASVKTLARPDIGDIIRKGRCRWAATKRAQGHPVTVIMMTNAILRAV